MPKLSAIDLAMFLLESPARPFNIGPLVLLRPPAEFRSGTYQAVIGGKTSAGSVECPSLTFLGGQTALPNVGGIFILKDEQNRPAYRVRIPATGIPLDDIERVALVEALRMSNWVQKDAADLLSISPRVMNYKINRLGIEFPRGRRSAPLPVIADDLAKADS